jgi:hypothetical protein
VASGLIVIIFIIISESVLDSFVRAAQASGSAILGADLNIRNLNRPSVGSRFRCVQLPLLRMSRTRVVVEKWTE